MTTNPRLFHLVATLPFAIAGCAPGGELRTGEAAQADVEANGSSLNGRSLNGRSLNGRSLNGRSLNGVSWSGVQVQGSLAGSTWLEGGVLHGVDSHGHNIPRGDFVGAVLTGILDDQSTLPLRIDAISSSPGDEDTHFYAVSYAIDTGWRPLCVDAVGNPTTAIPLEGLWSYQQGVPGGGARIDDPSAFTFACRGHALAKCIELGYEPWETVKVKVAGQHGKGTVSLVDHHQACTRLIRADYCGDGTSHTVDGTLINVYDGVGVQADTEAWPFEAEWGPDGARCAARQRQLGAAPPSCWTSLLQSGCGAVTHFGGTLLMSEDAP
jgi:hypothetical protein